MFPKKYIYSIPDGNKCKRENKKVSIQLLQSAIKSIL